MLAEVCPAKTERLFSGIRSKNRSKFPVSVPPLFPGFLGSTPRVLPQNLRVFPMRPTKGRIAEVLGRRQQIVIANPATRYRFQTINIRLPYSRDIA